MDWWPSHDIELHDVGNIPNSGINLISLGHLLQAEAKVTGEMHTITVTYGDSDILVPFTTSFLGQNMYTLKVSPVHSCALGTIHYQTVHCCLGHPSKEVIRQAKQHTSGLPDFSILENNKISPGCAKGKQPQWSFPPTFMHTKHAFELFHTDIKSFPTNLYHKYKYLIIFLDHFTSMAWTILLCVKSALTATCQFLQMVKMQFQVSIQGWMSNFGGEYKSAAYNDLLKGEGIRVYNSAPHVPQQNGHAERFMSCIAISMFELFPLGFSWVLNLDWVLIFPSLWTQTVPSWVCISTSCWLIWRPTCLSLWSWRSIQRAFMLSSKSLFWWPVLLTVECTAIVFIRRSNRSLSVTLRW